MEFNIDNGLGFISVHHDKFGDSEYFKFKNPVVNIWYDGKDTIGYFMALLPFNEQDKQTLKSKIVSNLYEDFTDRTEELYEILKPLLDLFENGKYKLEFLNQRFDVKNFNVAITETNDKSEILRQRKIHRAIKNKDDNTTYFYNSEFPEEFPFHYDDYDYPFIGIQPLSEINKQRVDFYVEKIKNGERPFAIIFESENSVEYILDGHHKILAYQELKIYPPIALITALNENNYFDVNYLLENLYPWQIQNYYEEWSGLKNHLRDNPESFLKIYNKEGKYKIFNSDEQLICECNYENGKLNGDYKSWYDNGIKSSERFYNYGKIVGNHKFFHYSNGALIHDINYDESECRIDEKRYNENGKLMWETFYTYSLNRRLLKSEEFYENRIPKSILYCDNDNMIINKYWNEEGKIELLEIFDNFLNKPKRIDITENIIKHYSTQKYLDKPLETENLEKNNNFKKNENRKEFLQKSEKLDNKEEVTVSRNFSEKLLLYGIILFLLILLLIFIFN